MSWLDEAWDLITDIPGALVDAVTDPVGTIEDIITGVAGAASEVVHQVYTVLSESPHCLIAVGSPAFWQTVVEIRAAKKAGIITNAAQCELARELVVRSSDILAGIPGLSEFWYCACKVALSDEVTDESIAKATAVSVATFGLSAEDQRTGVISAVSWGPNRLDFVARGKGNGVLHKCYTGQGWYPEAGWSRLGGQVQQPPAIVAWGRDRLDLFVCGGDRSLWHKCFDGAQGWYPSERGWNSLGGQMLGGPSVASWGPGHLHVVVRGTDNAVHYLGHHQGKWTGWTSLGGQITDAPQIVSWGPGRVDVLARGTDGQCWHRAFDVAWKKWAEWEPLGGSIVGAPQAVCWGPNRLDIVVRGTDNGVWHKSWTPNGYYPRDAEWGPLKGNIKGTPSIVSWGPGRLDIVARGRNGGVWHKCYAEGSGWYPEQQEPWSPLGGEVTGSPTAISWGAGHLGIVAQSKSGSVLYRDYHEGGRWMPEWADLGGAVK